MIQLLQSSWFAAASGILSFFVSTWLFLSPAALVREAATASTPTGPPARLVPSWEFKNPELEQLLAEAQSEREALRKRAAELHEYEARLRSEWQEISAVTQRVNQLQADLQSSIITVKNEESGNLKRLAKMYSTMKPDAAARILSQIEPVQAVRIMAFMKETQSAMVLQSLAQSGPDEKLAAEISEKLRLLRTKSN